MVLPSSPSAVPLRPTPTSHRTAATAGAVAVTPQPPRCRVEALLRGAARSAALGTLLSVTGLAVTGLAPANLVVAGLALAGSGGALLAQNQPPTQDPQTGNTPRLQVDDASNTISFSMNESNGMEMLEFIKWAQEITGRTFIMPSEADLNNAGPGGGRVSFLGTLRMKRDRFREDFFSFFQTMLYIRGFSVVPRGEGAMEMLEIIAQAGTRQREISNAARYVPPDEIANYRNQTGVPVLTTVSLKNINAQIAQNSLRPFFTTGAAAGAGTLTIGTVGNNSAMLLQGYGPQVSAAVELLKLVDVPLEQPNLVVQVVVLDNAAPEEVEPILTEVLESRVKIRQQVLQEQGAGQGGAPGVSGQSQLKVVVNSTQRALVLSGTQEQVRDAMDLIARLDVPPQLVEGTASVIRLKNVLAKDLRTTLNTFMQDDNTAEQQAQQGQGAGATAARRVRRTVIQDHVESNSLLISAAATKYKQIVQLIDHLDVRQPQVMIEAALVELSTGDLQRFGIELGLIDLKENGDFTRPFGFSHFGQSSFRDTDGDGLPDTRLPDFNNPLQGLTGGIISGGDFAIPVLINALASDDLANILSLPSVLVNNNENATVKTEEERPTTQATQGTATTNTGVGPPRTAGITLSISPTISPNNYLRLNIKLEVSRFVGAFDPNSATGGGTALRRIIETQVTMPSNATMVLGGVIEDSESYNEGGVPFLKDLPILGFLFRRSEQQRNKTNLYFFVTPSILDEDDFQDLFHISLQRKLEAEQYIGERRLRIIDRKWTSSSSAQARVVEDAGATIEDFDAQGGYKFPFYERSKGLDLRPVKDTNDVPWAPTAPRIPGSGSNQDGTLPRQENQRR